MESSLFDDAAGDIRQRVNYGESLVLSLRYERIPFQVKPPLEILGAAGVVGIEPPGCPDLSGHGNLGILHKKPPFAQIRCVEIRAYPHGLAELSGSVGKIYLTFRILKPSPRLHYFNAPYRLKGSDQNAFRHPFLLNGNIHAVVHAVDQVDVCPSSRQIVARRIVGGAGQREGYEYGPTLINLSTIASLGPAEAVAMKDTVINALTKHPFFRDIPLDPLATAGTNLEETVRLTGLGDRSKIPDRSTHLSSVILIKEGHLAIILPSILIKDGHLAIIRPSLLIKDGHLAIIRPSLLI